MSYTILIGKPLNKHTNKYEYVYSDAVRAQVLNQMRYETEYTDLKLITSVSDSLADIQAAIDIENGD